MTCTVFVGSTRRVAPTVRRRTDVGADPVCVDTLIPGLLGRGKGSLLSCRVEVFLKEFKRDAVAMYENVQTTDLVTPW